MDIATLVGVLGGLIVIAASIGADSLLIFINVPAFAIVIIGTCCAILVNYPIGDIGTMINVIKKTLLYSVSNPKDIIPTLVDFGTKARRDGILVLQSAAKDAGDPFLGKRHTVSHRWGRTADDPENTGNRG